MLSDRVTNHNDEYLQDLLNNMDKINHVVGLMFHQYRQLMQLNMCNSLAR